jgi:CRISP-associated protein Cas1
VIFSMQSKRNTASSQPFARASNLEAFQSRSIPIVSGVASLTGFGVSAAVERGQLVLRDGTGSDRRAARLARPTSGLKRLVVRGRGGYITFDALAWLHGVGAGLVQIGYDGELLAAIGPQGLNDASLRRAQALAPWNGTGPGITRDLLLTKLHGQASVLQRIPGSDRAVATIVAAISEMEHAEDVHRMRTIEGKAALAYWRAWDHVPVPWVRRDGPRVPEHWHTFGARMSPLSLKPRYGVNPPNAILNYLYSVLEAETTIAARSVGLDPGMGLLHVDDQARDSLALDIMEAARPRRRAQSASTPAWDCCTSMTKPAIRWRWTSWKPRVHRSMGICWACSKVSRLQGPCSSRRRKAFVGSCRRCRIRSLRRVRPGSRP